MTMEPEHDGMQADFERRLFESAQSDGPPAGATERAWLKFAAAAGMLAPLAAALPPRLWLPRPWSQRAGVLALKWLLIGAIGGGSWVAFWLRFAPTAAPGSTVATAALAQPVTAAAPPSAASQPAAAAPPSVLAPSVSPSEVRGTGAAPAVVQRHSGRTSAPASAGATGTERQRSPTESQLAREVAALDAARSALAVGAHQSALRQIEQYHREFPAGELSAEADVVAVEALAAAGDRTGSRRAAQTFLEQHPRDPHVARVRELAR